jgi:hypothetical protein
MILNIFGVEDRRAGPKTLSVQDQTLLDELLASQAEEKEDEDGLVAESGGEDGLLLPTPDPPPTEDEGGDNA